MHADKTKTTASKEGSSSYDIVSTNDLTPITHSPILNGDANSSDHISQVASLTSTLLDLDAVKDPQIEDEISKSNNDDDFPYVRPINL